MRWHGWSTILVLVAQCWLVAARAAPTDSVALPAVPAAVIAKAEAEAARETAAADTVVAGSEGREIVVVPGVNAIITVAIAHLNRIVTPFADPRVHTVTRATTRVVDNVVYVATEEATPVTLFITDGEDETVALSLTLVPRKIPPREIWLRLDAEHVPPIVPGAADPRVARAQPYITRMKTLLSIVARGEIPHGYALRPAQAGEAITCAQPDLTVTTAQVVAGRDYEILIGVARNHGTAPLAIAEAACGVGGAPQRVLAVAAWPRIWLAPDADTEVFVVVGVHPPVPALQPRPSLLGVP